MEDPGHGGHVHEWRATDGRQSGAHAHDRTCRKCGVRSQGGRAREFAADSRDYPQEWPECPATCGEVEAMRVHLS